VVAAARQRPSLVQGSKVFLGEEGQAGQGQVLIGLGDGEADRSFGESFSAGHGCDDSQPAAATTQRSRSVDKSGPPQPRDEAWRRPSLLSPRQIQALSRTAPNLPLRLGGPERADPRLHQARDDDPVRGVGGGHWPRSDQCFPRHRHAELLAFLKLVVKADPRRQLHVVLDNYGTHTHAEINAWLARHPRI
jgi:hypothetical protein